MRQVLEKLLDDGRDDALLRFTLGGVYLQETIETALVHLRRAIEFDPSYSAAWKLIGAAMLKLNRIEEARRIWTEGRSVARKRATCRWRARSPSSSSGWTSSVRPRTKARPNGSKHVAQKWRYRHAQNKNLKRSEADPRDCDTLKRRRSQAA